MDVLRSYVVRLYRQGSQEVVGMVESVTTRETRSFRSPEELWSAVVQDASEGRSSSIYPREENET
jgi:chemotaxis methyl-accepting protein methylase